MGQGGTALMSGLAQGAAQANQQSVMNDYYNALKKHVVAQTDLEQKKMGLVNSLSPEMQQMVMLGIDPMNMLLMNKLGVSGSQVPGMPGQSQGSASPAGMSGQQGQAAPSGQPAPGVAGAIGDIYSKLPQTLLTDQGPKSTQDLVKYAASYYGNDPNLLAATIAAESGGNQNAQGGSGEVGLGQLMPGTGQSLGVTNRSDPYQNLMGSSKYLKQLTEQFGNIPQALVGYQLGPNGVPSDGSIPPNATTAQRVLQMLSPGSARGAQGVRGLPQQYEARIQSGPGADSPNAPIFNQSGGMIQGAQAPQQAAQGQADPNEMIVDAMIAKKLGYEPYKTIRLGNGQEGMLRYSWAAKDYVPDVAYQGAPQPHYSTVTDPTTRATYEVANPTPQYPIPGGFKQPGLQQPQQGAPMWQQPGIPGATPPGQLPQNPSQVFQPTAQPAHPGLQLTPGVGQTPKEMPNDVKTDIAGIDLGLRSLEELEAYKDKDVFGLLPNARMGLASNPATGKMLEGIASKDQLDFMNKLDHFQIVTARELASPRIVANPKVMEDFTGKILNASSKSTLQSAIDSMREYLTNKRQLLQYQYQTPESQQVPGGKPASGSAMSPQDEAAAYLKAKGGK